MIQGQFKQLLARYDRVRAKLAKFVGSSTGPHVPRQVFVRIF